MNCGPVLIFGNSDRKRPGLLRPLGLHRTHGYPSPGSGMELKARPISNIDLPMAPWAPNYIWQLRYEAASTETDPEQLKKCVGGS
jgi:hypothetical protein